MVRDSGPDDAPTAPAAGDPAGRLARLRLPHLVSRLAGRGALPAAAVTVVSATALVAVFGLRLHRLVLFDEKYTIEGARWFSEDAGRVFELLTLAERGIERLNALLLLPVVQLFSSTADVFVAGHLLFAVLHGLTGVAAWLIARDLGAPALWPAAAAALATLGPWALFGATFLNNTPAAAFAAFGLWAVWRTAVRPSVSMDVAALAFLSLSTLARVSHAVLFVAFAATVLVQAARDRAPEEPRWRGLALAAPRAARAHVVPATAALAGLVALLATDASLVGQYPKEVDFAVGRWLERVERGIAIEAAGTAFVPAALAVAWLVAQAALPRRREAGAFAVAAVGFALALAVVNLAGGIDERYELPLAVPVAVAFAVAAGRREPGPAALLLGAAVTLAATHRQALVGLTDIRIDYLAMPAREWFSQVLVGRTTATLGVSAEAGRDLLAVAGAVGTVAAGLLWRRAPLLAPGIAVAAIAIGIVGATWALKKVTNYSRPGLSFADMAFVERATGGATAHPLAHPGEPDATVPKLWNELQYFNEGIPRVVSIREAAYGLCCLDAAPVILDADDHTGAVTPTAPIGSHILTTSRWLPRGLNGEVIERSDKLELPVRVERLPRTLRLAWTSSGFTLAGSVPPGGTANLRVFPTALGTPASCLRVTVHAPVTGRRTRWRLGPVRGSLAPATSDRVDVPLPRRPAVDLEVTASGGGAGWQAREPASVSLSDLRLIGCGAPEPA